MNQSLLDAMRAAGLEPVKPIELIEGKVVRYRPVGDKAGSTNGWVVWHERPVQFAAFGSWKTGALHHWRMTSNTPQTAAERAEIRRQTQAMHTARAAAEAAVQEAARAKAAKLWARARPATNAHPYLQTKCVPCYGLRQLRDMLLVPARDSAGVIQTIQFIGADGTKRFLTGGRISGSYFSIGRPLAQILIAEGLATASTLRQATGNAVAVCFSCGNLLPVALALRQKYPRLRLVVCADDDRATPGNPGLTHALAAAQAVGGYLAVPQFSGGVV
ncbi:MAG: hypothetical protein KDH93_21290 [Rhodoferax sp.]|nr:hypothetical protein [Rhodoferax sp.]MCP5263656.1 hypothetical protein [Rhodoferax sp.]